MLCKGRTDNRDLQILWWSLGVTLQLLSFIAFILVSGFTRWLMGLGLASYPILVAVTLAAGHYRDVFYSRRAVRAVAWAERSGRRFWLWQLP